MNKNLTMNIKLIMNIKLSLFGQPFSLSLRSV